LQLASAISRHVAKCGIQTSAGLQSRWSAAVKQAHPVPQEARREFAVTFDTAVAA